MDAIFEGLEGGASPLPFVPVRLSPLTGDWDSPIAYSEFFDLSFLFPVRYAAGQLELGEGLSLERAIQIARSCQAYDGQGAVWAIVRPRVSGGRKVRPICPWGQPPRGPSTAAKEETQLEMLQNIRS